MTTRKTDEKTHVGNFDTKLYAILGGPWLKPAQEGCRALAKHMKQRKPVEQAIEEKIGQEIEGLIWNGRRGCDPGSVYLGFALAEDKSIPNWQKYGLKQAACNRNNLNAYAARADRSGRWLKDLLVTLNHDGFQDFVFVDDKFPYAPYFSITDDMKVIQYIPRVIHNERVRSPRSCVSIGYDTEKELKPRDLPEGLLEVPSKVGEDWLNGKIKLSLS